MIDDPKPEEIVQGANSRTCTVEEFNSMTDAERRGFVTPTVTNRTPWWVWIVVFIPLGLGLLGLLIAD